MLIRMKKTTIDLFFKIKDSQNSKASGSISIEPSNSNVEASIPEYRPSKAPRIEFEAIDISSLKRDPELHRQISDYPINHQDEIQRAYIKVGPYQHVPLEYPQYSDKHRRRSQAS